MLTLVPTPIGNLEDITFRAIEILKTVDFVIAEDTRTSGYLLKHFQISKPMFAYHIHNEHRVVEKFTRMLKEGQKAALITDAGTPGLSDPGYLLVKACIDREIAVQCLPGPTALIPALVVSGLPSHRFYFEGFLPHKKGRQTRLEFLSRLSDTFILYESPHRVRRCLTELAALCEEDRPACICRELSKLHEEVVRGTLGELISWADGHDQIKGEIAIVVGGSRH